MLGDEGPRRQRSTTSRSRSDEREGGEAPWLTSSRSEVRSARDEAGARRSDLFLVRTYAHLLGAIVAFVALQLLYFSTGLAVAIAEPLLSVSWLLVLGGFIVVSWLATRVAASAKSRAAQYAGLGIYGSPLVDHLRTAALRGRWLRAGHDPERRTLTLLAFIGLTRLFRTGKDFAFLAGSSAGPWCSP